MRPTRALTPSSLFSALLLGGLMCGASHAVAAAQSFRDAPARPITAASQTPQPVRPETHEQRTGHALEYAKANDGALFAFLLQMPKGGDLHNHITGAAYAESFIRWAAADGLCVDRESHT